MKPSEIPPFILELAIRNEAAQLKHHVKCGVSEYMLDIHGIPDVTLARVRVTYKAQGLVDVSVLSVQGQPANPPIVVADVELTPELVVDDGSVVGRNGVSWQPVAPGFYDEAIDVDDRGELVFRTVNTAKKPWKLECACGQPRYSSRGNIHKIDKCHVCAKKRRHDYRVAWQRTKRKSSSS